MLTRQSAETTAPERDTAGGKPPSAVLAIRWLFPAMERALTPLGGRRLLLGRSEDCDVKLEGGEASRHHAEILQDGPIHVLRDLGSRNGFAIDGVRLTQAPLSPGNVVRIGGHVALVVENPGCPPDAGPTYREFAENLFGGPAMAELLDPLGRVSARDLTVVLIGETGTGKECFARAVHQWSGRRGPFVAVNCAAIPDALAESELFGHRKGAFTNADRANDGYLRAANGGTLLLDEVTELTPQLQAKLLRAVERREVVPVGESIPVPLDVRFVVASQESLDEAVEDGRFRGDLFARLDELTVRIPPLRARKEDIPYLFQRLLRQHMGGEPPAVDARLVEQLCLYDWPFNVRELDRLAKRLLALHGHEGLLRRSHLPDRILRPKTPPGSAAEEDTPEMRAARDLAALLSALRKHRGNVTRATREIGMPRAKAYRLMEARPDLKLDDFRAGAPRVAARDDEP